MLQIATKSLHPRCVSAYVNFVLCSSDPLANVSRRRFLLPRSPFCSNSNLCRTLTSFIEPVLRVLAISFICFSLSLIFVMMILRGNNFSLATRKTNLLRPKVLRLCTDLAALFYFGQIPDELPIFVEIIVAKEKENYITN